MIDTDLHWRSSARAGLLDAPAVLGLERFTELDERYAFVCTSGTLRRLLGALTRGGMLIANAADQRRTRNAVARTSFWSLTLKVSFEPRWCSHSEWNGCREASALSHQLWHRLGDSDFAHRGAHGCQERGEAGVRRLGDQPSALTRRIR
jgi:hypothetical protein